MRLQIGAAVNESVKRDLVGFVVALVLPIQTRRTTLGLTPAITPSTACLFWRRPIVRWAENTKEQHCSTLPQPCLTLRLRHSRNNAGTIAGGEYGKEESWQRFWQWRKGYPWSTRRA